jgi:lipoprotein-releasing system permease protein
MGGWLRMFRANYRALTGDLIVSRSSRDGFSHYEEMIDQIKKLPDVKAATPVVHTFGLVDINNLRNPVEVMGIDLKQIGEVNGFINSLHLQPRELLAKADEYERESHSLELQAESQELTATAQMFRDKAASFPSWDKPFPNQIYRDALPNSKTDPAKRGGIIVGCGVIGLRGKEPRDDFIYQAWVKLTVLKASAEGSDSNLQDQTSTNYYWIIDDSRTGVFQIDQNFVYLPFDVLQKELGMQGGESFISATTGQQGVEPARCNEILISLNDVADLYGAKARVQDAVDKIVQKYGLFYPPPDTITTDTWEERQADFLGAVEHEKILLVILFAIISVVAVFLIFCIFFMIVMEKTRDIGIVKSVGATSASVAGIFLGYGLSIGLLGGGLGLLLAYLVVHNINQIHSFIAAKTGLELWSAKTYIFDTIPNTMDHHDVAVIVSVAILSSVLGALVPAIRAARMNPVEALRWE